MKRKIAFILILSSFLWMFGCAKDSEWIEFQYLVQTSDASDSAEGVSIPREFALWNSQSYQESSLMNQQLEMKNSLIMMQGTYKQSQIRMYEYFPTHEYSGDKLDSFTVDSNGNLVGFVHLPNSDASVNTAFSEEECLNLAKKFFKTMVEDIGEYKISAQYQESLNVYYFYFIKYVDSFPTADQATIGVLPAQGHLYMYKATMIGQMDVNMKPNIDRSKLDEAVNAKLEPIITKLKERYDEVECESLSYTLTRNENQYILICDAIIKYVENDGEYQLISNEMIQFVIT